VGVDVFQRPSTSTHITNSARAQRLRQLTGLCPKALDGIITRRNKDAHLSTLSKLDDKVCELRVLLPHFKVVCQHECAVLAAYDAIKASLPGAFR